MLRNNTPIEQHVVNGKPLWVKREDLCCEAPGPSFSKMRGVVAHIQRRDNPVIGVLDTFHSQAGWGVAYAGQLLGRQVVNYWPRYKADPPDGLPRQQQKNAAALGAEMVAIPAGRSAILYHRARKHLRDYYGRSAYMVPNALKILESTEENAKEAERTAPQLIELGIEAVLLSVSSGTVASGVIRGLRLGGWCGVFILHMGYSRSPEALLNYIGGRAGEDILFSYEVVNENYRYTESVDCTHLVGFPCHPYYDAKALLWWANSDRKKPTLLWNVG